MKALRILGLPVVLSLTLAGCQGSVDPAKDKVYDLKARVVAVAANTVELDHEDIPGLMKAMRMKFAVEDSRVLEGIKPGDQVEGKLKVKSGQYVITDLKKR